jgi:hypothetical protein
MKAITTNTHTTSESWLRAATDELRPTFAKLGFTLSEKIRFSMAFTSTGKRGTIPGECWHPEASEDGYYKIILRPDTSDPVEILGILVHELVHALLPPSVKHGKEFRTIANRIGLEGKMRHARPDPILRERLQTIADNLGTLPNAKLNYGAVSDRPKQQKNRHHKAECSVCSYSIRITAKWAKVGLPVCPANAEHGLLHCDLPDDEDGDIVPDHSAADGDKDKSESAPIVPVSTEAEEAAPARAATHHGRKKYKTVLDAMAISTDASAELSNTMPDQ